MTDDARLSHIDDQGRARMVDVTPKEPTHRRANARCRVLMKPETASAVARGAITKGVIDGRDIVFFCSMIAFWLFATVVVLDAERAA